MITTTVGKFKVELYDSISELPIRRFYLFNKLALIDAGIGSNLEDVDAHLQKIYNFIDADPNKAKQELKNLRQQIYLIQEQLSVEHLAFAPMIRSVNGKTVTVDTTDDAKELLDRLNSVKANLIEMLIGKLKKK